MYGAWLQAECIAGALVMHVVIMYLWYTKHIISFEHCEWYIPHTCVRTYWRTYASSTVSHPLLPRQKPGLATKVSPFGLKNVQTDQILTTIQSSLGRTLIMIKWLKYFLGPFALKIRKMVQLWDFNCQAQNGLAVFTLWVYQPTSPCPTISAHVEPISQGHC